MCVTFCMLCVCVLYAVCVLLFCVESFEKWSDGFKNCVSILKKMYFVICQVSAGTLQQMLLFFNSTQENLQPNILNSWQSQMNKQNSLQCVMLHIKCSLLATYKTEEIFVQVYFTWKNLFFQNNPQDHQRQKWSQIYSDRFRVFNM